MNAAQREKLARDGLERWEAGDFQATLALLDPEIEVFAPPEIGNSGTYRGIEGFLEWTGAWYEAWGTFSQQLLSVEAIGATHVLARVHQTGTGKGSGIPVERGATWAWELADGRVVYMALFFDDEKAVAHARERESFD